MDKKYKCSQCDYRGNKPSMLKKHEVIHSSEKPYVCHFPECGYRSRFPGNLKMHQKQLHPQGKTVKNKFKCSQCDLRFEYPSLLKIHMKVHDDEETPFSCDVPGCDYKSRWKVCITTHKKLVHEDENTVWYECDKCDYRTKYEYFLKARHSRIHAEVLVSKKFKCELCSFDADDRGRLEDHMRTHTGEKKSIRCDIQGCEFAGNNKLSVYMHKKLVHWEKTWYKCDQCPYQTWHQPYLTRHMKIHSEEKAFRCTFEGCEYRSRTKGCVTTHWKRHDWEALEVSSRAQGDEMQDSQITFKVSAKVKRYPCTLPHCHFVGKAQYTLARHLRTHDPNRAKSFKCPLCPKMFFTVALRQVHVKSHTNEKPFKCTYPDCNHRAYYLSQIKKHEHVHRAEKAFKCDYPGCGYSATRKVHLKKHKILHETGREPRFECNLCSRRFYTKSGLTSHVLSHTNEKPFKCLTCDYAAIHTNVLKKHRCAVKLKKSRKNTSEEL